MMLMLLNLLIISISILISVAFYTILERKILSYIQLRKGPNKAGMMGILQPFSDALKLFNKNLSLSELTNYLISYITPALSLFMSIMMIPLITFNMYSMYDNKHNFLLFFLLSSMTVYFILLVGWSTNCKYSHMGAIRSIAQMISYEVSLFMIILFITIMSYSYSFMQISKSQMFMYFAWGNMLLLMFWMITCLAETNRSPFDFAESESELVSGFNVEYMGGWFAMIFLAEYMSMIILMLITTIMFFTSLNSIISNLVMLLLMMMLLWVRGTYPRFRYDMLMKLSWKILLPISLMIIPIPMIIMFYFV